jgi:hypothetical protein
MDDLYIKEEVKMSQVGRRKSVIIRDGPLTPSIGQQQQKVHNPQREQRANALAKILEQGHKRGPSNKRHKKKQQNREAEMQANQMVSDSEISVLGDDVYG